MARGGRAGRLAATALWLSLLFFAAALALQKIQSLDYWWHLRAGAFIAETGGVPRTDPFTFTEPDVRWIDIHWLHQLGLYAIYALGGHAAVVASKLVLVLGLVGLLAPLGSRRERPIVTVGALALALAIACPRFMPRPELPSLVLLAATTALLDRFERRGDAWVYAVVAVQLVWVNLHGLFALGIALCWIHLAAELARAFGRGARGVGANRVRRLAAVSLLATLAALVNPNFLDGALYPLHQLGMVGPPTEGEAFGPAVGELARTFGPGSAVAPLRRALFAALAVLSFAAMALNARRLRGSDPLVWGAFLFLALGAHRNLALFAVVAAPILVRNANALLDRGGVGATASAVTALAALVPLALGVDVLHDRFYPRLGVPRETGLDIVEDLYPVAAVDWIERELPPGPLCNHMADGGYVIWRLFPRYLAMTGGWRLEASDRRRMMRFQVSTPERFERLDRQYRFGAVLVHHALVPANRLIASLNRSWSWRLAFVDDVAAVFVRVGEDEMPWENAVDIGDPGAFPPLADVPSERDVRRRIARANFYRAVGRYNLALDLWEQTVARYPEYASGRLELARLLRVTGRTEEADALLQALLAERPDSADVRVEEGNVRLSRGDREGARRAYDEALAADPRHPAALLGLERLADDEAPSVRERLARIAAQDRRRALVESATAILLGVGLWGLSLAARRGARASAAR